METEYKGIFMFVIVILLIWLFFGGNLFNGNRGTYGDCSGTSNCEVEKQTIINTATIQNLINEQAEATRAQASRIYEAQQAEKLFDLKLNAQTTAILNGQQLIAKDNEIALLNKTIADNEKYCMLNAKIDAFACVTPRIPPYYARGFVPTGECIPSTCGTTV